ncbi:hypothetical protein NDU88_002873 [Pleurodeles waltl]|uniref:SCAN box domain-containing protein n=1 Tax=Pleurodeles waltl TaxID=8319 RepID=A0AAV7NEU4_PLEWA|nr:hypothetical protein NDU88_002873 [Pleurodeles waltl]
MRVPTQGASKKEDFQVALRAWAEAHLEEDDEEEEPENGPSEDLLLSVDGVTTAIVPPSRPGSSVSVQSLTAEERREEREFQLQMAKLKIEAQQEERRAEREAKQTEAERAAKQIEAERAEPEAERALAEKLLLAHELSLKELDLKGKQSESSNNGGSILTGPAGDKKVRIPKNVVPSFVVGDDIDKWLAAYEVALRAHEVPEGQWGVAMWGYVPPLGRDTLLTLDQPDQNTYPFQKATLLAKFGLTPEGYRQRFRDSTKQTTQTWVDFFDFSSKELNGWVRGNKVDDYKGLYDLILREHMLNTTFTELRQHLVDSKLTDPRKLAEEADLWVSTRVSKKVPGGDTHKGGQGSQQKKEGGDKLTDKELSKGPQKNSQGGGGNHSFSRFGKKPGTYDRSGKSNPKCMECYQYGHYKGDPQCSKRAPSTTGQTPGLTSVALGGNDLEHTAWKEVELRSHLEMLGLPEWVCMTTRSMADREGSQGRLEPGTMAQRAAKRRGKGRGKPAPEVPTVVDGPPE